jgi:deazaflavin-dependent oxidoreductase (nitroreductase family)
MADQPKPRAAADDRLAKMVTTDWFRAVAPKVIPRMHRAMRILSRGKFVPGAGLILTTVGAKSGKRRETPLEAVPCPDGTWVIVGSNFAQAHHPAWTTNLIANPDADVLIRGRTMRVRADLLAGDERAEAWQLALAHFGGWQAYTEITDRAFRIFRLTPA